MVSFGHIAVVLGLVCLGEAVSNHIKHEDSALVIDAHGDAVSTNATRVSDEDGLTTFEVSSDGHAEIESPDNKPLTRKAKKKQAEKEAHEDKPHKLLQADEAPVKSQSDKLVRADEKQNGPHPNWLVQADEKPAPSTLELKADQKVERVPKGAALVQADAKEAKATSGSDQQADAKQASAKSEKQLVRQDARKKKANSEKATSTTVPPVEGPISLTQVYDTVEVPETAPPPALTEVGADKQPDDSTSDGSTSEDQTTSDDSTVSQPASEDSTVSQPASEASTEEAATPSQ